MQYYALFKDTVGHTNCIPIPDAMSVGEATRKAIKEIFLTGDVVADLTDALAKEYGDAFACEDHLSALKILEVSSEKDVQLATLTKQFRDKLIAKKKAALVG